MGKLEGRNSVNHRDPASVLAERVNEVYLNEPLGLIASVVNASVLAYIQWRHVPDQAVMTWYGAVLLMVILRLGIRFHLNRQPVTPETAAVWSLRFKLSVGLSGIVWGAAAIFLFPQDLPGHQVFTAFVIGGMTAGAAASLSPLNGAFLCYALPALSPLLWRFGIRSDEISLAMAFMVLLFGVLIWNISRRIQSVTWSAFALRFEKHGLVDSLSSAVSAARMLNETLKVEISEKEAVARDLQRHREQLETLVESRTAELQRANLDLEAALSEKIRAEVSLRESEEKHRLVVDHTQDGICVVQDGKIELANPVARKLMDLNNGKGHLLFLQENPAAGTRQPAASALRLVGPTGEDVWVELESAEVTWESRPAILYCARDITQRRKLEDQLQLARKMESLGTLAGGVAHEFNNLLMGLGGQVSLMLADLRPGHANEEKLRSMENLVHSGAALTRQLLGFAMGGRYEVQPSDMSRLVEKIALLFGRTHKGITLNMHLQTGIWVVEVDRAQIEQVLLNICLNGAQAMSGGGTLTLSTRNASLPKEQAEAVEVEPGDFVVVDIADTGGGIDRKVLNRIFDPFFTTQEMGKGAGLGLASAYGIIRNHGGFIGVATEADRGSVFSVYLPRSHKAVQAMHMESRGQAPGGRTVLLVDDEIIVLRVAEQMFKRLGCRVLTAQDGLTAVEIFKTQGKSIDLVVLDMIMPGMNGEEVFERLRQLDPQVKVLLSSGYSADERVQSMVRKGCLGFVPKPYNLALLAEKIDGILGPNPDRHEKIVSET